MEGTPAGELLVLGAAVVGAMLGVPGVTVGDALVGLSVVGATGLDSDHLDDDTDGACGDGLDTPGDGACCMFSPEFDVAEAARTDVGYPAVLSRLGSTSIDV